MISAPRGVLRYFVCPHLRLHQLQGRIAPRHGCRTQVPALRSMWEPVAWTVAGRIRELIKNRLLPHDQPSLHDQVLLLRAPATAL